MLSLTRGRNDFEIMEANGRAYMVRPLSNLECRLLDFSDWLDEPVKMYEAPRDFVGLKID